MKQLCRGLFYSFFAALFLVGCASQTTPPDVVERTPPNAEQLLREAQQQPPQQAVRTQLEAAFIFARQGQSELALATARDINEDDFVVDDRIRWALFYSSMAKSAGLPDQVLRATEILNDEPPLSDQKLKTLQMRRQWALEASNQFNAEQFNLNNLNNLSHIGIFLPESGPLGTIASTLSDVIKTHNTRNGKNLRLSFFDTQQFSLDDLYEKARQQGVEFVIGPLSKQVVSQLENRRNIPLPTLALNYGRGASNQAQKLIQFGLSAEDEARQVAQRAWSDGHRQMAVMVPDNAWGRRTGEAFWDEWNKAGGSIINAVSYDTDDAVTKAIKSALNVRGERAQLDNIDALFLLATPAYARQVPPTLDFYYASELPIYGTSHLHEGMLQPRLNKDLDDVFFVDIPWQIPDAAVGGEEVLPYYNAYSIFRHADDKSMFRLKAMGVDAYEIAVDIQSFIESGRKSGATGQLILTSDGRIYRELPWAQFQNGIPSPILAPDVQSDDEP